MSLQSFLQWWNLAFELPFLLALVYTLLLATGTVDAGQGGDADADVDADVDVDHDFDAGVEHTVGGDHPHHESHAEGGLARALGFLGIGRVPLSIVLVTLLYVFGFTGWAFNQLFDGLGWAPELFFWPSVVLALLCAVVLTRQLAFRMARILPSVETYGIKSSADLVGHAGVASHTISDSFGMAQVKDPYGNTHQVYCRTAEGAEPIPPSTSVRLQEYDPQKREFVVITEGEFDAQIRRR